MEEEGSEKRKYLSGSLYDNFIGTLLIPSHYLKKEKKNCHSPMHTLIPLPPKTTERIFDLTPCPALTVNPHPPGCSEKPIDKLKLCIFLKENNNKLRV